MCFDKELKPLDCKVPASEVHRCENVFIKPVPGKQQPHLTKE
jgi:hypothetical protein